MSCNQESLNKMENVDYFSDDLLDFSVSFARGKAIRATLLNLCSEMILFHKELVKKGKVIVTVLFNSGKINYTLRIQNEQPENRKFITSVFWPRI